jgi:uncharacterized protein
MSDEVINDTIKFVNDGNASDIFFFGGEPMLHWEGMKKVLEGAKVKLFDLTTNGTLLNEERLDILKKYNVSLNLSFDGMESTQNYWRDSSYNEVMKNIDGLLSYPKGVKVLKTMVNPLTLYDDVKHIKSLGFKQVFINMLDAYGDMTYENYNPEDFVAIYKKVINDFNGKDFTVVDFSSWKRLIDTANKDKKLGCGFVGRGLCTDPVGKLYPCHHGPSLNNKEKFVIGDVKKGLNPVMDMAIRMIPPNPSCGACDYRISKCYANMYNKYGKFGVDPPEWAMLWERTKLRAIEEILGYKSKTYRCDNCGGCKS